MKRLKKINKRICAAVMIIAMGLSMISGTRVLAAEEMNTDTKREDESEIITQPEETEVTNPETETKEETINENIDKNISNDDKITEDIALEVQKPMIQYVYVEKPNLQVGEKQKIVVSFSENIDADEVVLLYQKENSLDVLETNVTNEEDGAKEFDILRLLLENPQRVYTKAQIYSLIWNDAYMGDENAVNVHISRLRTKIEDDPRKPQVVITVWGIGYKLGEQK